MDSVRDPNVDAARVLCEHRRLPRLALPVVLAAACAAGCIHPRIIEDGRANQPAVDDVMRDVARQRELRFQRDVPIVITQGEQLGAELKAWYDAHKAQTAIEDAFYHRLGVLPPDASLSTTYTRFYVSFVGGIYDPRQGGKMILVEDYALWAKIQQDIIGHLTGKDWAYELFLAHELVHALQDQHFGLDEMVGDGDAAPVDADTALARKTLLESEAATLGMAHFFGMDLRGPFERQAFFLYLRFNNLLNGPLLAAIAGRTPSFFTKQTFGQYELGLDRIQHLLDRGGWDEVSRSYLRAPGDPLGLPQSTEQLLHKEKIGGDAYDPPVRIAQLATPPASIGATRVLRSNVFGELLWRLYLEGYTDGFTAARAAAGWGGDRYDLVETPAGDVLCWRTTWDTAADARELADAYQDVVVKKYGARATRISDDDDDTRRAWTITPWREGDAGPRTKAPEIAAVVVRGQNVVLVDGAAPAAWEALVDELFVATITAPADVSPTRAARARALEQAIERAPDAGPTAPPVVDRLVLPHRTFALRTGAAIAFDAADRLSVFPDAEMRWGVRRGLEWTLPLTLTFPLQGPLGMTAPSIGLTGAAFSHSTGLRINLLFGLLHALPLGDRAALVVQALARLQTATAQLDAARMTLDAAAALTVQPFTRLVLTPGLALAQTFTDVGAGVRGAAPIHAAERYIVLGAALARGVFTAPLVELQITDMLHVYEATRVVLDPSTVRVVGHEHAFGAIVYF